MAEGFKLTAERRSQRGTAECRRLRNRGIIPGNLYGHGQEAVAIAAPAEAVSSTQTSFESAVPCVKWWPTPSVRTTTSTRYERPGFSSGISGRSGATSGSSIVPPSRRPKMSRRFAPHDVTQASAGVTTTRLVNSVTRVESSPRQPVVGQTSDTVQLPLLAKSVSPRTRIPSTSWVALLNTGEPELPP